MGHPKAMIKVVKIISDHIKILIQNFVGKHQMNKSNQNFLQLEMIKVIKYYILSRTVQGDLKTVFKKNVDHKYLMIKKDLINKLC